jgi:hypothetical protein
VSGDRARTGDRKVTWGRGIANVVTRSAVVLALVSVVGGCANDAPNLAGFASTSALAIANAPPMAARPDTQQTYRKTMSDRVLAAIALERVTGMKPDPSRFSE